MPSTKLNGDTVFCLPFHQREVVWKNGGQRFAFDYLTQLNGSDTEAWERARRVDKA